VTISSKPRKFNFCPSLPILLFLPPLIEENKAYKRLMKSMILHKFEEAMDQASKYKTKQILSSFTTGRQDNLDDLVSLLANIDALTSFIHEYNEDHLPLVVQGLCDTANFLTTKEFKRWYTKHIRVAP